MSRTARVASFAYGRAKKDFGADNVERVLMYGAILVGGYVVLKAFNFADNVKDKIASGLRTAGEALGSGLFSLFHKNPAGESLYYTVNFPTLGRVGSVASSTVDKAGFFMFPQVTDPKSGKISAAAGAKKYQLLIDNKKLTGVNKTAFPA